MGLLAEGWDFTNKVSGTGIEGNSKTAIDAALKTSAVPPDSLLEIFEIENTLRYDEPPIWFYPAKLNLGAVLLLSGKYSEAERIYMEHLEEYPENGWALYGLQQALLKQNKSDQAVSAGQRFNEAWKYADIQLTSSRIL